MSESSPHDTDRQDDDRLIPDHELPEDLRPEENPLAAEPDESEDTGQAAQPDS